MYATIVNAKLHFCGILNSNMKKNKGKLLIIVKKMNFVLVKIDIVKSICVVLFLLTPG